MEESYSSAEKQSVYSAAPADWVKNVLLEPIYYSSVPIQDVARKTSVERWPIVTGGERGLERSVLAARHDDAENDKQTKDEFGINDDLFIYLFIFTKKYFDFKFACI